jgi:phosphoribosylaminoimidazole-succinocarboxamide synthase
MTEAWINEISARYIELYEKVIGEKFVPERLTDEEVFERVCEVLEVLEV